MDVHESIEGAAIAPPEPPIVVEHREQLIFLLREAAELEHAIMCEYLFAAFTLKQRTDEGVTAEQLAAIDRWRTVILKVATQEMLHLALVQNLLTAVGAAPYLSRPDLPSPARHFPPGVRIALIPFGERALRHFLFIERPEGMALEDPEAVAALTRAKPVMDEDVIVPQPQSFATVGHLYRAIDIGFAWLVGKLGAAGLFIGPPSAQATREAFGWPELVPVTDLTSAHRAIDTVVEQGEGPRASGARRTSAASSGSSTNTWRCARPIPRSSRRGPFSSGACERRKMARRSPSSATRRPRAWPTSSTSRTRSSC